MGLQRSQLSDNAIKLKEIYYRAMAGLDSGRIRDLSDASFELRDNDFQQNETEQVRRLLSFRVNLLSGVMNADPQLIDFQCLGWIAGEQAFLKGIYELHQGRFDHALLFFRAAEEKLALENLVARSLLSAFNVYASMVNTDAFVSPEDELKWLRDLELRCFRAREDGHMSGGVLALIGRERSYILYDDGKKAASLDSAKSAIEEFKQHGPETDFMLALLHAAMVAHELGEGLLARTYFEQVSNVVEPRVEFPKAFVASLLSGGDLDLQRFKVIPVRWKELFIQRQTQSPSASWSFVDGVLRKGTSEEVFKIRENSLEGALIRLLLRGPSAKTELIEALWPEENSATGLENRFFRLLNRLNEKTAGAVQFDGKRYSLIRL